MFEKSWRRLTARLSGKRQSQLRFTVHRHPEYRSFWHPSETADQRPGLQIQIYLEASNLAGNPCWITAAEIAGMTTVQTVIGVRDVRTREFAPDNPLPPRQIATVSLRFGIDGPSLAVGEPFRATVILTDHVGEQHPVNVIMH